MKNRILIIALLALALVALGFWTFDSKQAKKSETVSAKKKVNRPNIILIMADDMGYSDIGCYGGEIETPNLDQLAANGLRFSQFYNTSRCCPTRASLLTGLYPAQTGVGMMLDDEGKPGYRGDLNTNSVTIAEVLKSAGYRTYMSGKWHVTQHLTDVDSLKYNWPRQRGFDRFYGTIIGAGSYWDPFTLARDNSFVTPENDLDYRPDTFYYTDAISDNAVKFIEEGASKGGEDPFFMYVSYTAAHWPLHAPEKEIEHYKGRYDQGYEAIRKKRLKKLEQLGMLEDTWDAAPTIGDWEAEQNKEWHARNMEVYAAMVTRMDRGIGQIIKELERTGNLENTLILYLQDNGGSAEELQWAQSRNTSDTLSTGPVFEAMRLDELQSEMFPNQTRDGYPVIVQSEKVLSGSDQTYNAYGPTWANVSNTPFRKYKHWVNEGGISTPLIAYWPSKIKDKGDIRNQASHLVDIMATVVETGEANYPISYQGNDITPMEGKSLMPVFLKDAKLDRDAIYFEHEGNRAIRQGKWKLVSKANGSSGIYKKIDRLPMDQWDLYDMENDRTEIHDLSQEHPEIVRKLSEKWFEWAKRTNTIPKPQ